MAKVKVVKALSPEERTQIKKIYSETLLSMLDPYARDSHDVVFFAYMATAFNLNIVPGNTIAGVNYKRGRINIFIGPRFLEVNIKARIAIIIHEVLHVICKHFGRQDKREHERWNYACDFAINQKIKDIPQWALHVENYDLPQHYNSEAYYDLLDEETMEQIKSGGCDLFDNHEFWIDTDDTGNMSADVDFAVRNALNKSRGLVSADLYELIKLNRSSGQVNWKNLLRKSLNKRSTGMSYTIKKRNRRYRDNPNIRGVKKRMSNSAIVVLDVSGSMSSEHDLEKGLNEVRHVCKVTNTKLTIIQVDTEVKQVDEFKKNQTSFARGGNGGTTLYPAIEYIKDNKLPADNVIVITDGCIESHWDEPPQGQVIFLLTGPDLRLGLDTSNFANRVKVINLD